MSKLPPEVEAIRQKYLARLSDRVVTPARDDLEGYRDRLLQELHSLEESSDPLIAEDSKVTGMVLEARLNRADLMDRLLEEFRREFEAIGTETSDSEASESSDPDPTGDED